MKQDAIQTRRLYQFEDTFKFPYYLTRQRSRRQLSLMAKHINPSIDLIFNKGILYNGKYQSYQEGQTIALAPNQRDYLTLAHELAHSFITRGSDHCPAFINKYLDILDKYFIQYTTDTNEIMTGMLLYKIKFSYGK